MTQFNPEVFELTAREAAELEKPRMTSDTGMYLEYDWTFNVYRPRLGDTFTDWRGHRSFATLAEARASLHEAGCMLGAKTDSRTWCIIREPLK